MVVLYDRFNKQLGNSKLYNIFLYNMILFYLYSPVTYILITTKTYYYTLVYYDTHVCNGFFLMFLFPIKLAAYIVFIDCCLVINYQ